MKIVLIDWVDSCSLHGSGVWSDKETVSNIKPHKCRSAGFVIYDGKDHIIVASSDSGDECSGDMCIPKSAITKTTVLHSEKAKK